MFEFSSSNGFSSFTLLYECRTISLIDTQDENQNPFSYYVSYPSSHNASCDELGYEDHIWNRCTTTIQGKKCCI